MSTQRYRHGRPTVGVLAGWQVYEGTIPHSFLGPALRGIDTASKDRGCNLLIACGVGQAIGPAAVRPAWPLPDEGVDFVPVGPWNSDGLIAITPLISAARSAQLQKLRSDGYPVAFLGTGEAGPSVVVDNPGGIRQAIAHMVAHGHRRIAYIGLAPDAEGDGKERLEAYHSTVKVYGLEADPRLVGFGRHNRFDGHRAMQQVLASGVQFTAVLASNDESALGAMAALQESARRVPQDAAVIGFDDRPLAAASLPPLTSVHYPTFEAGYRALELLLKCVAGADAAKPSLVRVATRLSVRRSCGCHVGSTVGSSIAATRPTTAPIGAAGSELEQLARQQARLAQAMAQAVPSEGRQLSDEDVHQLCLRLVEAFVAALDMGGDPAHVRTELSEVLRRIELADDDAHAWQAAVSVLQNSGEALLGEIGRMPGDRQVEEVLHQARIAISESAQRRFSRYLVEQGEVADRVGLLTARLMAALDESQIEAILAEDLPGLGIRHAHVAFFDAEGDDPTAWSRVGGADKGLRFMSRTFPPPELASADSGEPFRLALLPLVFQAEALGYVAFDSANLEPCAAIARQLAAAFKSARLHAQVLELSLTDGLTGVHNRRYLELFLRNEVKRSRRYARSLAVIMLDLDHFKSYNDAFGHPAGDEALRRVADCVMTAARRGLDFVARYGGEEFALVLPETELPGAAEVAERIRLAVAEVDGLKRPITVSLGVAAMQGEDIDAEALIQRADSALYEAKRGGRNRVASS